MTSKTKPLHLSAAVAAVDDEDMGAIMNEVFCPDALTRFLCCVRKNPLLLEVCQIFWFFFVNFDMHLLLCNLHLSPFL